MCSSHIVVLNRIKMSNFALLYVIVTQWKRTIASCERIHEVITLPTIIFEHEKISVSYEEQ